jgi:hypothetical protein
VITFVNGQVITFVNGQVITSWFSHDSYGTKGSKAGPIQSVEIYLLVARF